MTTNCFHPVTSVHYRIPEHFIRSMSGILDQLMNHRDAKRILALYYLQNRGKSKNKIKVKKKKKSTKKLIKQYKSVEALAD